MEKTILLERYPFLKELIGIFRYEVQQAQRPANQVVLNDEDVLKMLKISKRKLQSMRSDNLIPFSRPIPKSACYYLLSDILEWLKKSRVEAVNLRIKL